ncbi:Chaperone protein dnaJ 8, chloroplastic [Linum grandiflorum]
MAISFAANGTIGASGSSSSWLQTKNSRKNATNNVAGRRKSSPIFCVASSSSSVMDPYKTLRIQPGASESEVRKAFRKLALQYHPDVCKGKNCGVQFSQINEAYGTVMSRLREEPSVQEMPEEVQEEPMYAPDYELWEEWMGWEGAGIRDYTSHINPYI